jgi:selenide,water dikinase
VPGGTGRNLAWIEEWLDIGAGVDDLDVTILADAQTSGGLVFGVDPDAADDVVAGLVADGHTAAVIGRAIDGNGRIALRRS